MRISDLSSVYDYAREVLSNEPHGVYEKRMKEQKKIVQDEVREYVKATHPKKKTGIVVIPIVLCLCAVLVCVFYIKGNSNTEVLTAEHDVSETIAVETEYVTASETVTIVNYEEPAVTTSGPASETVTATSVFSEITTEASKETMVSEDVTTLFELDEDSVETYNGFFLGEIVNYSGTVHYIDSDTNKLAGACRGGLAIISGIQPDALHKFHLVTAEDSCTVYGWVDEFFVEHVNTSEE